MSLIVISIEDSASIINTFTLAITIGSYIAPIPLKMQVLTDSGTGLGNL